jgi:hypothetical protein
MVVRSAHAADELIPAQEAGMTIGLWRWRVDVGLPAFPAICRCIAQQDF